MSAMCMPCEEDWNLDQLDDLGRRDRLMDPLPPTELLESINVEATKSAARGDICLKWKEAEQSPGHFRLETKIPLSQCIFDQLFNGRSGYRAHYYLSPETGTVFNQAVIDGLRPALQSAFGQTPECLAMDWDKIEASLKGCQSKIWIADDWAAFMRLDQVLRPSRWVEYWNSQIDEAIGLCAPLPEEPLIDLKGAYVDPHSGEEWPNPRKIHRARQIFQSGWT